jgi:NAD(P)-dependent dehydrogenase (short-subunit alcohol dehydrogenase family)
VGTGLLEGKVVVVTGGRRGIGLAMAQLMAKEGARVWATSRQTASPRQVLAPENGGIAEVYLDVTQEESVRALFERIDASDGRIDVLVNNAGLGVFKPVEGMTLQEWENVINTNLTGVFLCSREAFKRMKAQGGGRIINIASVAGYIPLAGNIAYGASKYGVRGLSEILNEEGKAHQVRVSVVSPGAAYTEIWHGREGFSPDDMLKPEDVAEAVLDIARRPLHVRIDEVKILPPKGVL